MKRPARKEYARSRRDRVPKRVAERDALRVAGLAAVAALFAQLFRAADLPATLRRLKAGYRVIGTALGRGRSLETLPRDRAIAVVLGNEERGLAPATLQACNEVVTIAGSGWVQSLNVAASAAILMHALHKR